MNPVKFVSPHLDTPNSRYDFCKFATKSRKTNKEKSNFKSGPTAGYTRSSAPGGAHSWARGQRVPHVSNTGAERGVWLAISHRRWDHRRWVLHHYTSLIKLHRGVPSVGSVHHWSNLTGDNGSTTEVLCGGLIVSDDDTIRRAWLQR